MSEAAAGRLVFGAMSVASVVLFILGLDNGWTITPAFVPTTLVALWFTFRR